MVVSVENPTRQFFRDPSKWILIISWVNRTIVLYSVSFIDEWGCWLILLSSEIVDHFSIRSEDKSSRDNRIFLPARVILTNFPIESERLLIWYHSKSSWPDLLNSCQIIVTKQIFLRNLSKCKKYAILYQISLCDIFFQSKA